MINLKKYLIIVLLLLAILICSSKIYIEGTSYSCRTHDGHLGKCTARNTCPHLESRNHTATFFQCLSGYGKRPYVCCKLGIVFPDDDDSFVEVNTTPQPSLRNAQPNSNLLAKTSSPKIYFPDADGNFNIPTSSNRADADRFGIGKSVVELLPKPFECGPMMLKHKISNGEEAQLGEFPWLVNLEYRTRDKNLTVGCAGSILNHRFILTAAHCVQGDVEQEVGKLESLRAGDHNIFSDRDCSEHECMPPYQRYFINKTIVHDDFHTDNRKAYSDIALIKTDRSIEYTYYIAPICLPDTIVPMPTLRQGVQFTVAGWGTDGKQNKYSTPEKRIVDVPYVQNCSLIVLDEQICAGGVNGQDACKGDSGGSLCRKSSQAWFVEGIVSYGRGKCGNNYPSIYTKVRSYLPWIHACVDEN